MRFSFYVRAFAAVLVPAPAVALASALATATGVVAAQPAWAEPAASRPVLVPPPVPMPPPGAAPPVRPAAKPAGSNAASEKTGSKTGATKEATKEAVVDALKGSSPITQERVTAMGANADLVLIDLVRDNKADSQLRARAIDGLAASGTPVARDQLVRLATVSGDELEEPLLRRALLGVGWIRDGRAADVISPWLSHKSSAVRLDAGVALAITKTPAALELLERHRASEKDAGVRAKFDRLIGQVRHSLPQETVRRRPERPRIQPPGPVEGRNSTRF